MLLPNNPDLNPDEINEKLKIIQQSRRRTSPLFVKPAPTSGAMQNAAQRRSVRSFVKNIPWIGPIIARTYRLYRDIRMPGMNWKQRVLLVPGLGSFALWLYGISRFNKIRQQTFLEIAELRQAQQSDRERIDELASQAALRLQRLEIDALEIERRLSKIEKFDIEKHFGDLEKLGDERERHLTSIIDMIRMQDKVRDNLVAGLKQELHRLNQNLRHDELHVAHVAPQAQSLNQSRFGEDSFYIEFENLFRGSQDDIRERLAVYLPYLSGFAEDATARVVDVGCGRGEWLALLRDHSIDASGVDSNSAMIDSCRASGLSVDYGDAIDYLRQQDEASIAAITGFHIIEHLPFETLIALFDAALRALRPGGLVIFETPNPENLTVGACNFYYDPTHRHPIPPAFSEFVARQRGFARAEILRLHPYPDDHRLIEDSEVARRVNNALYGPQDYALLAWKTNAD